MSVTKIIHLCLGNNWPYLRSATKFSSPPRAIKLVQECDWISIASMSDDHSLRVWSKFHCPHKWSTLSKTKTEFWLPLRTIGLVQNWDQISIAFMNDRPYPIVWPKLSTSFLIVISPIQGMRLHFNWLGEQLPLSKSVTEIVHRCPGDNQPFPRSATKFLLAQRMITFLQKCDPNYPPMSRYWLALSKECNRIFVTPGSDHPYPTVWPNLSRPEECLPISNNAIKFQSPWGMTVHIQ
jgi:hypothetical protein